MSEIALGLSLGLAAGLAPGPLHGLVLVTALRRGLRAALRVAIAPLITDAPIIALAVVAVGALPRRALPLLAVAGGIYVVWLGLRSLGQTDEEGPTDGGELRHGVVTNLLNPHPWLFWFTVGAPTLERAWSAAPWRAAGFLMAFYGLLVGTKVGLAVVASRGRALPERWQRRLAVVSAVLLMASGAVLLVEGLRTAPR